MDGTGLGVSIAPLWGTGSNPIVCRAYPGVTAPPGRTWYFRTTRGTTIQEPRDIKGPDGDRNVPSVEITEEGGNTQIGLNAPDAEIADISSAMKATTVSGENTVRVGDTSSKASSGARGIVPPGRTGAALKRRGPGARSRGLSSWRSYRRRQRLLWGPLRVLGLQL